MNSITRPPNRCRRTASVVHSPLAAIPPGFFFGQASTTRSPRRAASTAAAIPPGVRAVDERVAQPWGACVGLFPRLLTALGRVRGGHGERCLEELSSLHRIALRALAGSFYRFPRSPPLVDDPHRTAIS